MYINAWQPQFGFIHDVLKRHGVTFFTMHMDQNVAAVTFTTENPATDDLKRDMERVVPAMWKLKWEVHCAD